MSDGRSGLTGLHKGLVLEPAPRFRTRNTRYRVRKARTQQRVAKAFMETLAFLGWIGMVGGVGLLVLVAGC